MSQRGSRRPAVQNISVRRWWWTSLRNSLALTILLTFGLTFAVPTLNSAEAPQPPVQVMLRVDGGEGQVTLPAGTVKDLLKQEDVALNEHDRVTPPPSTPLEEGLIVTVERVTFEILDEQVILPTPVITRWDRRMTTKPVVLREGKPGMAIQKRCIWKKEGVISVQWTQSQRVLVAPIPTIIIRGNVPSRTGRVLRMVATAYDPGPASCGRYASGRTAIGLPAAKGIIAVDPRIIPLGTRVIVEGYGPAVAGDVGGAIKGNKIDVCFSTRAEALKWGRRTVKVTIVD